MKDEREAKNIAQKRYRKNVDSAYDKLIQIKAFIKDVKQLENLSTDISNLKDNIDNIKFEDAISNIDVLFEKMGEISGTEELADKLDELISVIDTEEIDRNNILSVSNEVFELFYREVIWRNEASKSFAKKLDEYDLAISETIGLRLQERLTKKQAKYVSRCRSVHRDISLNF